MAPATITSMQLAATSAPWIDRHCSQLLPPNIPQSTQLNLDQAFTRSFLLIVCGRMMVETLKLTYLKSVSIQKLHRNTQGVNRVGTWIRGMAVPELNVNIVVDVGSNCHCAMNTCGYSQTLNTRHFNI